ncbi:MAG: S9 family peptidase [Terriglobales bacterium]
MKKSVVVLFLLMSTFLNAEDKTAGTANAPAPPPPPVAKSIHTENTINGGKLVDDYRWLRDKSNPEVAQYLDTENAYAEGVMKPTSALQQKLYDEMVSHIKETDVNVPYKDGGYFYYSRWEKGKQYPIFGRKKGSVEAAEEITLDQNELAKGQPFMSLGAYEVSDDGNLLAYSTDNTGYRQYKLYVRDLRSGKDSEVIADRVGSVAWANDNKTLFYTVEDEKTKRQYRLYRHELGTATGKDDLIYEEKDERFNVGAAKSRSDKYIFLQIGSHTTSEARYLDASDPKGEWKLIVPRQQDVEYYPDHHGDQFLIRTNDKGRTFRLVSTPVSAPGKENWKEMVPTRPDVMLNDIEVFEDFYTLVERENGLPQLTIVNFADGAKQRINYPEPVYTASVQVNREYKTKKLRYAYQSLVTPASVFDYDVEKHTSTLLKQTEVPGYDPKKYQSERVWATAKDGVKVPISLVYRKDLKKADGSNPIYVYAYGSYGAILPVTFGSTRLSLLDRGMVMAFAHIRGGGDLGKPWHDAGRMMNKMNTFTDFIACTEYLVANKYGSRDKIAIEGGSAGGLLMGAVTNLRPDLFKVVVSHVPFVDVMNTMLDASLPLTVGEYEEWGNPNEKPAYDYMVKYSPYDNLKKGAYPALLVKTSFNDSQVMYWEPAKYVAKLRTLKTDKNVLLLKTNMAAGHGGSSGRYDHLKEIAFDYAFMLTQLGL